MKPDQDLLTPEEAADVLRTTIGAVYKMVERGTLTKAPGVGRRVLIPRDDLRRRVGLLPEPRGASPPKGG